MISSSLTERIFELFNKTFTNTEDIIFSKPCYSTINKESFNTPYIIDLN